MPSGLYDLSNPGKRRLGMTKADYKGPNLLKSIEPLPPMAPKAKSLPRKIYAPEQRMKKKKASVNQDRTETEDEINAPPVDSSDDEVASADITRSNFNQKPQASKEEEEPAKRRNGRKTVNANAGNDNVSSASVGVRKSRRNAAPTSSDSRGSPKRKSREDAPTLGNGMADSFGFTASFSTKKPRSTYGGYRTGSQTSTKARSSQEKAEKGGKNSPKTPQKKFVRPKVLESPQSQKSNSEGAAPTFKVLDIDDLGSPVSTPGFQREWKHVEAIVSPEKVKDTPEVTFKSYSMDDDFDTSLEIPSANAQSPVRSYMSKSKNKNATVADSPVARLSEFKTYDLDLTPDIISTTQTIKFKVPSFLETVDDVYHPAMTQQARCPMCKQPVDPSLLREFGHMNIRKQERFCRLHKKRSAEDDKELNGYPDIKWDRLDKRITKHRSFIEKLINGANCPSRQAHSKAIKDRENQNLLKMSSNLTPGYYGYRGLRAITENIMHEFTPLLKRRNVEDPLMSARGVVQFVQSVLVPEVTVLLIVEDMNVGQDRAREILKESIEVGELLNEEVRDVVMKGADDSESEDEYTS